MLKGVDEVLLLLEDMGLNLQVRARDLCKAAACRAWARAQLCCCPPLPRKQVCDGARTRKCQQRLTQTAHPRSHAAAPSP